jgi:prepilin-type N-terminal cleavage/methylation domain-containing protein
MYHLPVSPVAAGARRQTCGFTLPEMIVVVVLFGGLVLLGTGTFAAARRLLPGRDLEIEGVNVALAPSPAAFSDAVGFHTALMARLVEARAVYVYGGEHVGVDLPEDDPASRPLALRRLPELRLDQEPLPSSATDFFRRHREQLQPAEKASVRGDFTLVVVGPVKGGLGVTALAQVRERPVESDAAERPLVHRSAYLADIDGATWSYAFLERHPVAEVARVGALHHWYRYAAAEVHEEGPAVVAFPDPWLFAGQALARSEQAPLPAYSRFLYCLPVDP